MKIPRFPPASVRLCLMVLVAVPAAVSLAYYEDLDEPATHSTFHYELMRLLGRAAGYSVADAELVAVANQATDLGTFTGELAGARTVAITGTGRLQETTATYFHFPRRGATTSGPTTYPGGRDTCAAFAATDDPCAAPGGEVLALEQWAMNGALLVGVTAPSAAVDGGAAAEIEGASLLGLGVYLHSLADSYSHEKCGADAHVRRHCLPGKPECTISCTTEFWHGQSEYGAAGAGTPYTREAARAVWQELKRFRELRELAGDPIWDDGTAESFIDSWSDLDRAAARRDAAISAFNEIATCTLSCTAAFAAAAPSLTVTFTSDVTATHCAGAIAYDWDFGDGSEHGSEAEPGHTFAAAGTYEWKLQVSADGAACSADGSLTVPAARLRRRVVRPGG